MAKQHHCTGRNGPAAGLSEDTISELLPWFIVMLLTHMKSFTVCPKLLPRVRYTSSLEVCKQVVVTNSQKESYQHIFELDLHHQCSCISFQSREVEAQKSPSMKIMSFLCTPECPHRESIRNLTVLIKFWSVTWIISNHYIIITWQNHYIGKN